MQDKHPETIDEYIKTFPQNVQDILQEVRQTIQKAAPDATEAISYAIPTFKMNGKYLIYFAGYKDYFSLYPIPTAGEALQKEMAPHISGKGTLHFALDQPIPYGLVQKIVVAHLRGKP